MSSLLSIVDVVAQHPGRLRITWDDDVTRTVDVSEWLQRHALLKPLNAPELFAQVVVCWMGGGVEWPNGADFCAQALRMRSDEQMKSQTKIKA